MVKRKGLDFTDCGLVDARQAKRQRLQQPEQQDASQFPVSIAMVDEWESFQKSFRLAVHAHTGPDGKELEMGVPLLPSNWLHLVFGYILKDCMIARMSILSSVLTCFAIYLHYRYVDTQSCLPHADDLNKGSLLEMCSFLVSSLATDALVGLHWQQSALYKSMYYSVHS